MLHARAGNLDGAANRQHDARAGTGARHRKACFLLCLEGIAGRRVPSTEQGSPNLWRLTGVSGIACVVLTWAQFPLWMIGDPPSVYDGAAFARHLFSIKNVVFTRILLDLGIYVSLMVFSAGFRHLIREARAECEWVGTLVFGAAAVWLGVTLVADGLEAGGRRRLRNPRAW